jgi:hypothetical protein
MTIGTHVGSSENQNLCVATLFFEERRRKEEAETRQRVEEERRQQEARWKAEKERERRRQPRRKEEVEAKERADQEDQREAEEERGRAKGDRRRDEPEVKLSDPLGASAVADVMLQEQKPGPNWQPSRRVNHPLSSWIDVYMSDLDRLLVAAAMPVQGLDHIEL